MLPGILTGGRNVGANMNARRVFAFAIIGAAGLGLIAASDPARAQVTAQGGGYLLRFKFVKGQTIKYDVTTSAASPGGKGGGMNFNMPVSMKITDVKNGVATIAATTTIPDLTGKGGKQQSHTETMKMDNRGRAQGAGSNVLQGMQVALPAGPVKIGSSWTESVKNPAMPGMTVKSTYKLVSVQSGSANVNVTLSTSGQGMNMTGSGLMKIAVADGWPTSFKMNMKMMMGAGKNAQPMAMTMTMTRK